MSLMHLVLSILLISTTTSSELPGLIPNLCAHWKFEFLNDWFDSHYRQGYPQSYLCCMSRTLLFLCCFFIIVQISFAQKTDSVKNPGYISGSAGITNNGIS